MISPILSAHAADTIILDFDIFLASQAKEHRVSQAAIISALRPRMTPSQPEVSSHAPAADTPVTQAAGETTDGGSNPSSLAGDLPSVAPSPEPQPVPPPVQADAAPHRDATSPAESDTAEISAPLPKSRTPGGTASDRFRALVADREPMTVKEVAQALGYKAVSAVRRIGEQIGYEFRKVRRDEFSAAIKAGQNTSFPTQTDLVRQCHAQNPTWPASKIAEATGVPKANIRGLARWAKLSVPSEADYLRSTGELPLQPEPTPVPITVSQLAPVIVDAPVEPQRLSPSTRFYLRDSLGRYVHQSLECSPADNGPLMTSNRKWAWFDTEQRFKGAAKKWPEIEAFRKEVPQK
ncbi:hypothetical protein [Devosia sp. FJ2-5-3]|uniref:hypothetical protein n=1 Tax=Devosia sp. FJ2-5-3 TaxID=2976680 RepID=UPI0023D7EFE6|nr:hypothetical protein [Devosia sp. FJ2-5-3]WEJ60208.1 hypothetical protein N0P34_09300 [Devosia sp. FJ2-5-3]